MVPSASIRATMAAEKPVVRIIAEMPIVATNERGQPLLLTESVLILGRPKRDGGFTNMTLRGTTERATEVHAATRLIDGRWFRLGTNEAVIGTGLARRLEGFAIGQTLTAGRTEWQIVGIFESAGSGLESEMWVDVELVQAIFKRANIFQSVLFRTVGDPRESVRQLEEQIAADPRLRSLQAETETAYYTKQAKLMADVITALGGILTAIMAIGAVVGAMNTMYAAVSQRKREIGCLLAIGFTPESVWLAFILESLLLSLIGGCIGSLIALNFNGMQTGTANWATFSEMAFEFQITPEIMVASTVLALLMGFIGGLLPAVRAARMKVVVALRRA
jgi:putative ABC transport system permease protein